MKIAVLGPTGLVGVELVRFLLEHPEVSHIDLFSSSKSDFQLGQLYPHLSAIKDLELKPLEIKEITGYDFVFFATPHGISQSLLPLIEPSVGKIIDLSADFRIKDKASYQRYYNQEHKAFDLVKQFAYGLPELHKDEIVSSRFVATPGCYSTAAILALYPLAKNGLIKSTPVVNGLSGISGAGLKLDENYLFSVANENVRPYSPINHRHVAEMTQELGCDVIFCPHLVPMTRGILITCYVSCFLNNDELIEIYKDSYQSEPFVKIVENFPATKDVQGTNNCHLKVSGEENLEVTIIFAAIDNLGKGAAGQAIQCFNLMAGFKQELGLTKVGLWP